MGLFDNLLAPFSTDAQNQASADQQAALLKAQQQGGADLGQARSDVQGTYATGLQPLQGTYAGATQGTDQLAKLLGLSGNPADMQNFLAQTPGYQFALNQGIQNVDRNRAAQGALQSGGTDKAVADYTTGLANQTYQNAVQNLMPYLGARGMAAGQIGGLAGQQAGQLANLGTAQAGMDYGTNVGIGNAQASADLAPITAGNNAWGLATNLLKAGAGAAGGAAAGGGGAGGVFGNIFSQPKQ